VRIKHILASAGAVALVLAGAFVAPTAASASTEPPPTEPPIVEVVEPEVTDPVTAPDPEPVAEPPAPEVVESEPVVEPEPAPDTAESTTFSAQGKGHGKPDFICDETSDGWLPKQDAAGNPATVEFTAPEDMLVDKYCVKAGKIKHIIAVDPPSRTVTIDHPDKDSVSHYQVHLIPAPKDTPPPVLNGCSAYGAGPVSTNVNPLWTDVDTRDAGHYEYVPGGLHIWTDDNSSQAKVSLGYPAAFPLHNTGVLDIQYEGTGIVPGINLFVDFDNDSTFDGILVYEAVYGQDLWLTGSSADFVKAAAPVVGGGNGSQWHGTIDQWLSAFPDAQVQGVAFALGSGVLGDGVIKSITVGCLTYTFDYIPPQTYEPTCTTVTGSQTIIGDGVLTVPGGWESATIPVPFTGTLADVGTVLNIEADPIQYVGLHIHTAQGTIVFEEEPTYGGNLWSTVAWDGVNPGMGYAAFGSITEFIHLNGAVEVTGIDLLYTHPDASSTTVSEFTIGCVTYTFEPVATDPGPLVEWDDVIETDCETRTVTMYTYKRTAESIYDPQTNTYSHGEFGDWVLADFVSDQATVEECPVPDTEDPDPTETPTVVKTSTKTLATTGGGEVDPLWPLYGLLIVAAGGLLVGFGKFIPIRKR